MPAKNLHDKKFDESTIAKLEIFEHYAQEWIPTFVMQGSSRICIFDLFAGTGYDKNGVAGSPIRILQKIKEQIKNILAKKVTLKVYFNEFERKKFESLKRACESFLEQNSDVSNAVEIEYSTEDFETLFPRLFPVIEKFPSLVYLDQNGIKALNDEYLLALEKTKQTDFLYFVSSSYVLRFGDQETFKTHLKIDLDEAKKNPYKFIHRSIIKQLREKLPANSQLRLYPYSLKKGSNIYGIIFGASHPRAVDKFLRIVWKLSPVAGDANFDIDDDELKNQGLLFGNQPLKKIEAFQRNVKEKILAKEITNNFELFDYTLEEGHIGTHAADELKRMKKVGEVDFEGKSPLVTYDNVYGKSERKVAYIIKK